MKTLLKMGLALIMFGVLLSALGVGIIRANAVKPIPVTESAPVSVSASASASAAVSATSAGANVSPSAKP